MKISVGKNYEGASSMRLEDGDYEVQITSVEQTKGRVNMTLTTSKNQKVYKTFFLLEKDGKTKNERGMLELADYVTTAMQIEDDETEVDVKYVLGFYLVCYIKNSSYDKTDENGEKVTKKIYNVYSPRRCDGFSDGTPGLVEKKVRTAVDEEEEEYAEPEEVEEDDLGGEPDDILAKYGV